MCFREYSYVHVAVIPDRLYKEIMAHIMHVISEFSTVIRLDAAFVSDVENKADYKTDCCQFW